MCVCVCKERDVCEREVCACVRKREAENEMCVCGYEREMYVRKMYVCERERKVCIHICVNE